MISIYVEDFFNKNFNNIDNYYKNTMKEQILKKIENDFMYKLKNNEDYIKADGFNDFLMYPDTKLHNELFPELYNFNFYHFNCKIKRCFRESWCGYITVNLSHIIWKDTENLHIHGEITYINKIKNRIGFDTNHSCDKSPFSNNETQKFRDRDYVILNLKHGCLQLYLQLPKWNKITNKQFPDELQKYFWDIYKLWYLNKNISKYVVKDLWIEIISMSFILEQKEHEQLKKDFHKQINELY